MGIPHKERELHSKKWRFHDLTTHPSTRAGNPNGIPALVVFPKHNLLPAICL
ncbi:hypothetical protein [Prevotella brunnea]|uniref:hypothetical protein n=1 Tax=Prevotella brunnea TaxID=2508867 RepID=UPI00283A9041|nr:hypothetical protein [Prevotella brunnea]